MSTTEHKPIDNIALIDENSNYGGITVLHIMVSRIYGGFDRHFPWFDTRFASTITALTISLNLLSTHCTTASQFDNIPVSLYAPDR